MSRLIKDRFAATEVNRHPVFFKVVLTYKKIAVQYLELGDTIQIQYDDSCQLSLQYSLIGKEGDQSVVLIVESVFRYNEKEKQINLMRKEHKDHGCINIKRSHASVKDLIGGNYKTWVSKTKELYNTMRWMYGINGADDNIDQINYFWSEDKENWNKICDPGYVPIHQYATVFSNLTKDRIQREIQTNFDRNNFEPLAHKLIREAIDLMGGNPRSSYIMGVTALEVGTKSHIMTMKPDTEWLLKNMSSPYIFKMIVDYFPVLHEHFKISDSDSNLLRITIDYRNQLVHKGNFDLSLDRIQRRLTLIKDLLLVMDYYEGNTHSKQFLSKQGKYLL